MSECVRLVNSPPTHPNVGDIKLGAFAAGMQSSPPPVHVVQTALRFGNTQWHSTLSPEQPHYRKTKLNDKLLNHLSFCQVAILKFFLHLPGDLITSSAAAAAPGLAMELLSTIVYKYGNDMIWLSKTSGVDISTLRCTCTFVNHNSNMHNQLTCNVLREMRRLAGKVCGFVWMIFTHTVEGDPFFTHLNKIWNVKASTVCAGIPLMSRDNSAEVPAPHPLLS
jgi:hypothetical protein